jgi:hypothetical protein
LPDLSSNETKIDLVVWLLIQTLNNQQIYKCIWCRKQWPQVDSQDWNSNVDIGLWEPKCLKFKKHKIVEQRKKLKMENKFENNICAHTKDI